MSSKRIVFHTGGADFHPTRRQAKQIVEWLDSSFECLIVDGAEAFEYLADADLLVLMGLFWTGDGNYTPPSEKQKAALRKYLASGRPLLVHHGSIASYDDWDEFGSLVGIRWIWDQSDHGPVGPYRIHIKEHGHPVVTGLNDFDIIDEAYYNLEVAPGLEPQVLAETTTGGQDVPILFAAERNEAAAHGRYVYIGLGHDERSFEAPALRQLWLNAVHWLLPVA